MTKDSSPMPRRSETARAFAEDGAHKTHIGGQALIEGVMMRGHANWAVAVREPNGTIYVEDHDTAPNNEAWRRWPLVRGCLAFIDSLALGMKALAIASDHAYRDDDGLAGSACSEAGASDVDEADPNAKNAPSSLLSSGAMTISLALGLTLGIAIFIIVPAFVTNLIVGEYDEHLLAWNLVDGLLRVGIFILYIGLIGQIREIRRMFAFHGAEHKAIHCFEHGLELTPHNARSFPRLHVRCGTAFLLMVMLLAIIVYTVVPLPSLISAWGVPDGIPKLMVVIITRILLLPLIAGLSYEVTVRWAGAHPSHPLVRIILWPGLQMQRLTTREPDNDQLRCAIAALEAVRSREETHDAAHKPAALLTPYPIQ